MRLAELSFLAPSSTMKPRARKTSSTNPNGPTYVLATGDQYGCSLHADFMMGWQEGILQEVINECSNLGFGNADKCPVFSMGEPADLVGFECQYSETIPDEAIGLISPVEVLPGCLLINGVLASGCNPDVSFVEPNEFDTQYRSGGWPIITDPTSSSSSSSGSTPSTPLTPPSTSPSDGGDGSVCV